MKIGRALIDRFDGGVVNDARDTTPGAARNITNFEMGKNPRRLVPYRSSEDGDGSSSTSKKQNFCIALRTGSTYSLYALGVKSGASTVEILYKNLTTGAATDLDDNAWAAPSNNQGTTDVAQFACFVYYAKTAMIYGIQGSRYVFKFDPSGGAYTNHEQDLGAGIVNTAQGIVHSKDDILYIPYDNKIASNNNGSWVAAALTLPARYYITSICEYGNYLAIAAAPLSGLESSRVYLWDRNSSLTTISENIDWGYGVIKVLEELQGYLVGVSSSSVTAGQTPNFKNKITFRYYTGAGASSAKEILDTYTGTPTTLLPIAKQKIGLRIHFMLSIFLNGSVREGVWSFGKDANGNWSLAHERTPINDTALATGSLQNFLYVNDFLFQAYIDSAGNYGVSKTLSTATYTGTSIFESQINQGMTDVDKPYKKQLRSVALTYNTLSAVSGQAVLKYRVDGASSYTTILTATVTGVNVVEQTHDASGAAFTAGHDYEFRIESQLGCEVPSLIYTYQILSSLL